MIRPILLATAVAGTLDILFAILLALFHGRAPAGMLRFVASGPFPGAMNWGTAGSALGLVVHFVLMGMMAAAFVAAALRMELPRRSPFTSGVVYGLLTYVVMNLVVVPLRFPAAFPPKPGSVLTQLFAHIMLVGIPIALITARSLRRPV
jgi:hypothetical protein